MKNKKHISNKKVKTIARIAAKRPMHRRIALHPISIFFLLSIGVLMLVSSFRALAASTTLSMSIQAPIPASAAVITFPVDQEQFNSSDITIRGSCPNDSFIKLYNNGLFSGAANCIGEKFELTVSLNTGANQLQPRVFNFTNNEGPASVITTVHYNLPVQTTAGNPPKNNTPAVPPNLLRIISDYRYSVYKNKDAVKIDLALDGGRPPYVLAIDWGDGVITPISREAGSQFFAEHTYAEKQRLYTYVVKIAASDSSGNTAFLQLMAVVDGKVSAASGASKPSNISSPPSSDWLKYLWPAYLILLLMVISFYLGEREERRILLNPKKTRFAR